MDYVSQRCDKNELVNFKSENIQTANIIYANLLRIYKGEYDDDDDDDGVALIPDAPLTAAAEEGTSPIDDVNLEDIELNDEVLDYLVDAILRENDFKTADSGNVPSSGSSQITVTNDAVKLSADHTDAAGEPKNQNASAGSKTDGHIETSRADLQSDLPACKSTDDEQSSSCRLDSEATDDSRRRIDLLTTRRRCKTKITEPTTSKTSSTVSPSKRTTASGISSTPNDQHDKSATKHRRQITTATSYKIKSTSSTCRPTTHATSAKTVTATAKSQCEPRTAGSIARKSTLRKDHCKIAPGGDTSKATSSKPTKVDAKSNTPSKSYSSTKRYSNQRRNEIETRNGGGGATHSAAVAAIKNSTRLARSGEKSRTEMTKLYNDGGDEIRRDKAATKTAASGAPVQRKNATRKSTTARLPNYGRGDSEKSRAVGSNFKSKAYEVESGVLTRSKTR